MDQHLEAAEINRRAFDERSRRLGVREITVAAAGGEHPPARGLQSADDARAELPRATGDEGARQRACSNRRDTASQFTTSHHAAR